MAFSFVQISDHHLRVSKSSLLRGFSTNYAYQEVLRHIAVHAAAEVDFIVATGDLVESGSEAEYGLMSSLLGIQEKPAVPGPHRIQLDGPVKHFPMYIWPGNHDDRSHFYSALYSNGVEGALFNAAFVHKGVQFVYLDWGAQDRAIAHRQTLEFLERTLKTELPVILLTHHQVAPVESAWLDRYIAEGIDEFWEIVAGKHILGIFCGHVHLTFETQKRCIPIYTVGSTGFQFVRQDQPLVCLTPPQYRVVTVDGERITTRVVDVILER